MRYPDLLAQVGFAQPLAPLLQYLKDKASTTRVPCVLSAGQLAQLRDDGAGLPPAPPPTVTSLSLLDENDDSLYWHCAEDGRADDGDIALGPQLADPSNQF
jgi:hypothetical protein